MPQCRPGFHRQTLYGSRAAGLYGSRAADLYGSRAADLYESRAAGALSYASAGLAPRVTQNAATGRPSRGERQAFLEGSRR